MKKIYLFTLLAILALGMSSCKYEEGPFISAIPKVERVTNTWVVNEANKNGTSSTSIDGFKQITFFKEGGCNIVFTVLSIEYAYTGTWAFSEDKSAIQITVKDELTGLLNYNNDWTIIRLKEDELKVSYLEPKTTGGTDSYIVTFEPAI